MGLGSEHVALSNLGTSTWHLGTQHLRRLALGTRGAACNVNTAAHLGELWTIRGYPNLGIV